MYLDKINFLENKNVFSFVNQHSLQYLKGASSLFDESIIQNTYQKNDVNYHSLRDPIREVDRIIKNIDESKSEHIVLFSAGLGYILPILFQRSSIKSILLIEPDVELLFHLINRLDWSLIYKLVFIILFFIFILIQILRRII